MSDVNAHASVAQASGRDTLHQGGQSSDEGQEYLQSPHEGGEPRLSALTGLQLIEIRAAWKVARIQQDAVVSGRTHFIHQNLHLSAEQIVKREPHAVGLRYFEADHGGLAEWVRIVGIQPDVFRQQRSPLAGDRLAERSKEQACLLSFNADPGGYKARAVRNDMRKGSR